MGRSLRTLGWAAYLACSWTWCIGMFLPVLLLRDFGLWGFIVFALPNVLGAGAMGWVLRSQDDAARISAHHRPAVRAFSFVTIAFHCFFLGWIAWAIGPHDSTGWPDGTLVFAIVLAAAVFSIGALVAIGRHLIAAGVLWLVSLGLGIAILRFGAWDDLAARADLLATSRPAGALWLAPVCIFGFLLCPYLDATFLKARRHLPTRAASHAAFGIGFGVLFFAMILLTLGYSAAVEPGIRPHAVLGPTHHLVLLLFAHLLLQSVFTILVHLRALPGGPPRRPLGRFGFPVLCIALVLLGTLVERRDYAGLALGEVVYRSFMSFYGLAFPAYVWICIVPTRDGHSGPAGPRGGGRGGGRAKLLTLAAAVTLATPFYWMGFIERESWYLAPGLAIVLLARLVISRPKTAITPTSAPPTSPR